MGIACTSTHCKTTRREDGPRLSCPHIQSGMTVGIHRSKQHRQRRRRQSNLRRCPTPDLWLRRWLLGLLLVAEGHQQLFLLFS